MVMGLDPMRETVLGRTMVKAWGLTTVKAWGLTTETALGPTTEMELDQSMVTV